MKIFVAASYSSQVNYQTGVVNPDYKNWLEHNLERLEGFGHGVFCALRFDEYRINNANPAEAFTLDETNIEAADGILAFVTEEVSAGVQTEIGLAVALKKQVVLAHLPGVKLAYINQAIVLSGKAKKVVLPFDTDPFAK